jgi:hypothetical protein
MKIKITDLEKKLNYKIKRNFTSIGFDCATTTGICILKSNKEDIDIDSLVLSFKTIDDKEKFNTVVKTFEKLIEDEMYVIVEDVYEGPNPAGAFLLCRYGAFALSCAIRRGLNYELISAKSARAKFFKIDYKKYGKGKSKLAVADWIKSLDIKITDNNIADGFILALLGMCEGMDFRPKSVIEASCKKAKKRK